MIYNFTYKPTTKIGVNRRKNLRNIKKAITKPMFFTELHDLQNSNDSGSKYLR